MTKISRNDPCPCGSGKKYKKCCLQKDEKTKFASAYREEQEDNSCYMDEVLQKDDWFSLKNMESDTDTDESEKNELTPEKQRKTISDEIPEITAKDEAIVDDWWGKYKELTESEDIRRHLEDFFEKHPKLVLNLELHHEVLFELGGQYIEEGKHGEYIALLLRIRKEFPDAYKKSCAFFDRDIISYKVMTGCKQEIPGYLNYFREYPDHDADNLFKVINYLMANNCQDIVIDLVKEVYYEVVTSKEIIGGDDILEPLILSYFIPYLEKGSSEYNIKEICTSLKDIKIPLNDTWYNPDYYKKEFNFVINTFTKWDIDDCGNDRKRVFDRYWEISLNFMRFLHEKKNKDWLAADYFRKLVYKYMTKSVPKGKIPKEAFIFTKHKIDEITCETSREILFYLNSTAALGMLNSLYYFAEYLNETESIQEHRKDQIQRWCFELYNKAYTHLVKQDFSAKTYERFPF